jgi:hypothetical protein
VETFYEEVKGVSEERSDGQYRFWRGFLDETVYAFLDCGCYEAGYAATD